jgi:AraC family transcriptional regulator
MINNRVSSCTGRMTKVCDYIQLHLDDNLSVDKLSQVAHFSKYHFNRQFADYVGVNVARYILLARLKRAAYQLAFDSKCRVIDAALNAGFENPESFSWAFKQSCSQTPSQFKQKPEWAIWNELFKLRIIEKNVEMNVEIVTFPETKVGYWNIRLHPV